MGNESVKDMKIDYRFNNGRGAVLCRKCQIIIDQDLSWDEAKERWTDKDICEKCKKGEENELDADR